MASRHARTVAIALALATAAAGAGAQVPEPDPCQAFTVVAGDAAEVEAIKGVLNRLQETYRGSTKSPTRFLRQFDATRFVSGLLQLERDVEQDFELLRNRELICRRGTLSIREDLAVLQSEWEKFAFVGPGFDRVQQRGALDIQLTRVPGRGDAQEWKITGLRGERIFGSTGLGGLADLTPVELRVGAAPGAAPGAIPFGTPARLEVTVRNLGPQRTTAPATVRVFDTTAGAVQLGPDQTIPPGLPGSGGTTRLVVTTSPFTTAGVHTLLVVVDPHGQVPELNETNNRLTVQATVTGSEGILTVMPNPNPVSFPSDGLTIRVTDLDQAGKRELMVRVRHVLTGGPPRAPAAFAADEEAFLLTETKTPGVFERASIPTAAFLCGAPGGPAAPAAGNGALEFPRNSAVGAGCFGMAGTATGSLTVIYLEPVDARGRTNVERRLSVTTTWPVL